MAEITDAFLRLQTYEDLFDLIALLRRGVSVCIEPVVGTIFGPVAPCMFEGVIRTTTITKRLEVEDLEGFLRSYLYDGTRFNNLEVEAQAHKAEIREAWEILNHAADHPLRAVGIAKLAQLLARTYGGSVEAQLPYGHPEWTDWVKGSHGHLTFWHQPTQNELLDIVEFGCLGIVRADAHREWYRGGLDFAFPDRGTLTNVQMAPGDAYEAAGGPSGLGGTWDMVRRNYRLVGLLCDASMPDRQRREIRNVVRRAGLEARQNSAKLALTAHGSCTLADVPPAADRLYLEKGSPETTAAWLTAHWASLRVVTFTGAGVST